MVTPQQLQRAGAILRAGGLVAFPTETVYGLGANALDAGAVNRIFEAKGRPATSPLIVHVDSVAMAQTVVREWSSSAALLSSRFWPGPLTLVLPKRQEVPGRVTAGLSSVGIRIPAHPVALALITAAGVPIAAPSANRFTEISPTTAEHVRASLGARVDCILDGGPTGIGIESTVLSLVDPARPVLLRPGHVTREEIEALIGPVATLANVEGAHPAPGMHHRHYSPRTPLLLTSIPPDGRGAYVWHTKPSERAYGVRMPLDSRGYAASLYATLHRLDAEGWDFIAVEPVPDTGEWAGVADRLRRAASR